MPRSAANRFDNLEFNRLRLPPSGFHFGQIQQIVHQFQQVLRGLADITYLLVLLAGQVAVRAVSSRPLSARIELSGERNSWLMFDRNFVFNSSARRR